MRITSFWFAAVAGTAALSPGAIELDLCQSVPRQQWTLEPIP